ncbi:MAG: SDR family NAD(P)-dependent oxidoreductase [Spirochaetes bacterium]|nr:SDR family NAD(P)-dependent oxidoreductase [Spirochaetota bacterium]
MSKLSKKTALITGGDSGLGFEMAKQMIAQGSTVIICGRSQDKLDKAKNKVPQLVTFRCDITKHEDCFSLYKMISEKFNEFNLLINNAGVTKRYLLEKNEKSDDSIRIIWETNYFASVMLARMFLPLLIKNKGTIVNVTSALAYIPLSIEPDYCASKSALHSMTRSMRIRFSKLGVKVVEIFYPAVNTPFQQGHAPKIAIKPDIAAKAALKGLNKGKEEIRVKIAVMMYIMSRLMPKTSVKILNASIPENTEKFLKDA